MDVLTKGRQDEEAGSRLSTATVLGIRSFRENSTCVSAVVFRGLSNGYCGSPAAPRLARSTAVLIRSREPTVDREVPHRSNPKPCHKTWIETVQISLGHFLTTVSI